MHEYNLFTDPHIGTRRAAHTTRESSKRLTRELYRVAMKASASCNALCGGDLFDRSFNDEATIVQGYNVALSCKAVISGNHDETNREGTVTSLQAIHEAGCPIIRSPNLSEPFFDYLPGGVYLVPHHASQKLFDKALSAAAEHAAEHRDGKPSVLVTHCNYDCGFAEEDDTLNLGQESAVHLLCSFDYIFLGHEHQPSTHFDGRLIIMGNLHPTSFSDISDKYTYRLMITEDDIQVKKELVWSKAKGYASIPLGGKIPDPENVRFIEVTGNGSEASGPEVAQFIQEIWETCPDLFAVRNSVQIHSHLVDDSDTPEVQLTDLKSRIHQDLEGSDLQDLFQDLVKEAEA